jgi:hypothetical protein
MSKFTQCPINNYMAVALVLNPGNIDELAQNRERGQINEAIG